MKEKYINEMKNVIEKHSKAMYDIDYELAFVELLKLFNKKINKIDDKYKNWYKKKFISITLDILCDLKREDIKKYIIFLKQNKLYKYETHRVKEIFLKYFIELYISMYMLKNKKLKYFYKRYSSITSKKFQRRIAVTMYHKNKLKEKKSFFKILLPNKLYVDYMELVITTKCTLRCKNCANLMPMYKKAYNVDRETIIKSIKKLEAAVDGITTFRILGGEPFCNPDLKYILKELSNDKYNEIIIVTNGTIVPKNQELINIMKEKNVVVYMSNYNNTFCKMDELIKLFEKEKINYILETSITKWTDYGILKNQNKDKKTLKEQFYYCNITCKTILNGEIYYCPRLAHGTDLGVINKNKGEYIDLLNNSDKKNKKEIKKMMLRNKYIEACNYCNYATKDCKYIPIAEQIK